MTIPIVHIGYHKTASTWLQRSVFPRLVGVRYGDPLLNGLLANLATATDELFLADGFRSVLRQLGRCPGGPLLLSDEGISGSLWDAYGAGPRNAERLARVLPAARIVILVRRQDDMLRSIHAQYVNEGGTRSLGDFLSGEGIEGSHPCLRHLEYDELVGVYADLFGREQVLVMPYEYLRSRPGPFLRELGRFLGARLPEAVSHTRLNRSLSGPSLWLLRAWNRLFRASRFNEAPLVRALPGGRRVRNLLQGRVDPVLRRAPGTNASAGDRRALADIAARFSESNQRLQSYCPQLLGAWDYPLPSPSAPTCGVELLREFEPAVAD